VLGRDHLIRPLGLRFSRGRLTEAISPINLVLPRAKISTFCRLKPDPAEALEAKIDEAVSLCGGDVRAALRATLSERHLENSRCRSRRSGAQPSPPKNS
jgi:hypothetical protein